MPNATATETVVKFEDVVGIANKKAKALGTNLQTEIVDALESHVTCRAAGTSSRIVLTVGRSNPLWKPSMESSLQRALRAHRNSYGDAVTLEIRRV